MPDRAYYVDPSPRMADIRGPLSAPHRKGPRAGAPARGQDAGRSHLRPRAPDRGGALAAAGFGRREEGEQPLDAGAVRHVCARARLARVLRRGRPGRPERVRRVAAERGGRHLGPGGRPAARGLEGLPDLPRPRALRRPCCRAPSARSASSSTAPRWPASPSAATAGSGRWTRPATRWARRWASSTWSGTSRPRPRRASRPWCATSSRPSTGASTPSTGWRRPPRPRPRRSWPC